MARAGTRRAEGREDRLNASYVPLDLVYPSEHPAAQRHSGRSAGEQDHEKQPVIIRSAGCKFLFPVGYLT